MQFSRTQSLTRRASSVFLSLAILASSFSMFAPQAVNAATESVSVNAIATNGCGTQTVTISGKITGPGNRHLSVTLNTVEVYTHDYQGANNTSWSFTTSLNAGTNTVVATSNSSGQVKATATQTVNVCTPPVDVCPNVTGMQTSGPCADSLCLSPNTWNVDTQMCVAPPVCPEGTTGVFPTCTPIPPTDVCANVDGTQTETPCADTICADNGGTWSDNTCNMPVDVCPAVDGMQTEGPCANDTCANDGGTWTENSCVMPTAQELCLASNGFWNGDSCEQIIACNDNQTYHADTNTCTNNIPECSVTQTLIENVCVDNQPEPTPDVDLCPEEGLQATLPCASVTPPNDENNGGNDNDNQNNGGGNGPISTIVPNNGGNGPIVGSIPGPIGSVLGASCSPVITSFLKMGGKNDPEQVKVLQSFLNSNLGLSLEVNGIFDAATFDAVKTFQIKYSKDVLNPWGISKATGFVYKTTSRMINMLSCSSLDIPMPELK